MKDKLYLIFKGENGGSWYGLDSTPWNIDSIYNF